MRLIIHLTAVWAFLFKLIGVSKTSTELGHGQPGNYSTTSIPVGPNGSRHRNSSARKDEWSKTAGNTLQLRSGQHAAHTINKGPPNRVQGSHFRHRKKYLRSSVCLFSLQGHDIKLYHSYPKGKPWNGGCVGGTKRNLSMHSLLRCLSLRNFTS